MNYVNFHGHIVQVNQSDPFDSEPLSSSFPSTSFIHRVDRSQLIQFNYLGFLQKPRRKNVKCSTCSNLYPS